jgi:hypothetical protein
MWAGLKFWSDFFCFLIKNWMIRDYKEKLHHYLDYRYDKALTVPWTWFFQRFRLYYVHLEGFVILHRFSKRSWTVARIQRAVRCNAMQQVLKQIHGALNKNERLTITFFKCLNSIYICFKIMLYQSNRGFLILLTQLYLTFCHF